MFMPKSSHRKHWQIKNVKDALGLEAEHTGVASSELAVANLSYN